MDAAAEFYGGLFGWELPEAENAEQTGGYRQAMRDGKAVAGVMPLMQEGQPPAWSTYVSVEDADATVAKVTRGRRRRRSSSRWSVLDYGRMAVFADPTGAVFGIWQPGTFIGAELVNEPGALAWNELNTRDPEAAKAFYGAVFGWTVRGQRHGGRRAPTRRSAMDGDAIGRRHARHDAARRPRRGARPLAGLLRGRGHRRDGREGRRSAAASVVVGPIDIPVGRFAVLTDPLRRRSSR